MGRTRDLYSNIFFSPLKQRKEHNTYYLMKDENNRIEGKDIVDHYRTDFCFYLLKKLMGAQPILRKYMKVEVFHNGPDLVLE